jgi:hypothetical protein
MVSVTGFSIRAPISTDCLSCNKFVVLEIEEVDANEVESEKSEKKDEQEDH